MPYARIVDGVVQEVFTPWPGSPPIEEMFHPDLVWVECDPEVEVRWTYPPFAAPTEPPPTAHFPMEEKT